MATIGGLIVDLIAVQGDGTEEVLAARVSAKEADELREWFSYTKPIGRGVKVVARPRSSEGSIFCVRTTGTLPGPSEKLPRRTRRKFRPKTRSK